MQLFKAFFKIAWKHLPSIMVYFAIYAVITFVLGSTSQKNIDANFESRSLDICVIDEDSSTASKALTSYLGSMHNLVELENDPDVLQDNLYYRYISYVLTIPSGFEEKLMAGDTSNLLTNVKVPGSATGYFVDQQISQYTQSLQIYLAGGYSMEEAISAADESFGNASEVSSISFQSGNAVDKKEVFYFYQYLPYIYIVLLLCGLAPIIIIFNKKNLSERINCSALSLTSRNTQLTSCCIIYSLLVWIVYLLLAFVCYGPYLFTTNALYAMLNSFVFLLIATEIALLISNFAPNNNELNMISNIIGLSMSFLCGVFVPQSMLSSQVLTVGKFLPAYWYVRANNMLAGFSTEPFNMNLYWTAIGIQLLFAAAIFAATLVASKFKRQRA